MIVMTVIRKIKMILLHLDNHKNASEILLQLFIKFLCLVSIEGYYHVLKCIIKRIRSSL